MSDLEKLPPLPAPLVMVNRYGLGASTSDGDGGVFTADQMREYARAALAQPAPSGEPLPAPQSANIGYVSAEDARVALDSMDDFARMRASVDPIGPRTTLERFIEQASATQSMAATLLTERARWPTPQPAPARVPLTDAEIDYLAKSVTTTRPGKIAIEFARAIEAAHGILPQQLKDEK